MGNKSQCHHETFYLSSLQVIPYLRAKNDLKMENYFFPIHFFPIIAIPIGAWRRWSSSPRKEPPHKYSELVSAIVILGILVPVALDPSRAFLQEFEEA